MLYGTVFTARLFGTLALCVGLLGCRTGTELQVTFPQGRVELAPGIQKLRLVDTEHDLIPFISKDRFAFSVRARRERSSFRVDLGAYDRKFEFKIPLDQFHPIGEREFFVYAPLDDYRGRFGMRARYREAQGTSSEVEGTKECETGGYCKKLLILRGQAVEMSGYYSDCPGKQKAILRRKTWNGTLKIEFLGKGHRPVASFIGTHQSRVQDSFLRDIPGAKCVVDLDFTP